MSSILGLGGGALEMMQRDGCRVQEPTWGQGDEFHIWGETAVLALALSVTYCSILSKSLDLNFFIIMQICNDIFPILENFCEIHKEG